MSDGAPKRCKIGAPGKVERRGTIGAYLIIGAGMILLGVLLWASHRVRSRIESRGGNPHRTHIGGVNEAETLSRTGNPFI